MNEPVGFIEAWNIAWGIFKEMIPIVLLIIIIILVIAIVLTIFAFILQLIYYFITSEHFYRVMVFLIVICLILYVVRLWVN